MDALPSSALLVRPWSSDICQKVSLCDDWTTKILSELEKDKARDVQSSRPQQQNLEAQIVAMDGKINKLIDIYLEGSLSLEEYQRKKEGYLNAKKDLQERLKDFAAGGDNWFERAKDFVTDLNRVSYALKEGNLESQREILEKIGSNFILKERRLNFSSEGTFRHYLSSAPYQTWRRGRDLNSRCGFWPHSGLAHRRPRPLGDLSVINLHNIFIYRKL